MLANNLSKSKQYEKISLLFHLNDEGVGVRFMVFNITFNNISVISWGPVLLVDETGVP
jgi:hypothetical protein